MYPSIRTLGLLSISSLLVGCTASTLAERQATCACGYKDSTGAIWRESFVSDFTAGWQAELQKNFHVSDWPEDHDGVPYGIQYTVANVYGNNDGLGMKTSAFPKGSTGRVKTAEIESLRNDILYGTFRMRATVPEVPGVCFGFFTYRSETQEADIEFLSSDTDYYRTVHLTNQPGLINGDTDPQASKTVVVTDGNNQVDFTAFNEHRLDWLKASTSYYYNGVKKQTVSKNSPSVASTLIANVWSDGGPLWTKGPPTQDAIATIYYIKAYFNSTSLSAAQFQSKCAAAANKSPCPV
ncbi:hypothetical protein FRC12_006922 [Ceratobasidium sp. 428]|nr:hypothetical protein FRC12_006922 [Ceratobasidium sp. 428]